MEDQIAGSPAREHASTGRPVGLRGSASLTGWVKGLLCCWMAVNLIALASDWALLHFLDDLQQGAYSSQTAAIQDAVVIDKITRSVSVARLALYLLTAVLFLRWVYRANENAKRLGAVDMEYTPGWAVGWYFVPVANLGVPYRVMREIWNASENPTDWRSMRGHPIIGFWWGLFLALNAIGDLALVTGMGADRSVKTTILSAQIHLATHATAIAAGFAAYLLVARVSAIQRVRASSN